MPWYKSGTVSVVQNSSTVTGTNTTFAANARVGDAFLGPDGRWYEVANIVSDTVLSLLPAYQGATTGSGTYALAPMQGYVKESADQLRLLVNKLGTLASAASTNALAAVTGSANKVPYFSAADAMALADFTAQGRSLLAAGDQAAQRNVMGLGNASTATVTTSNTDYTVGRLLKVGDFGIGRILPSIDNFDTIITPGTYYSGAASSPDGYGELEVIVGDPVYVHQRFSSISGRVWHRQMSNNVWQPWQLNITRNNLIGPVSQAAGVPTGSVMEYGSNASGEYVRFADGTLICSSGANGYIDTQQFVAQGIAATTVNLPAFFVDPTFSIYATATPFLSADVYGVVYSSSINGSQCNIVIRNGGVAQQFRIRFHAIGRWFR